MIAPVLMKFGSAAQKARFLPRIVTMDDWWCQGYSEPGAGSDLASLKTRAERDGEHYVVNGQKTWTSFAQWANWMFALVRTSADAQAAARHLAAADPDGHARHHGAADPHAGRRPRRQRGVPRRACACRWRTCVGAENEGWTIAKYLLGHERTAIAGLGMCKRLLRRLKELARTQARHGRPLIEDPRFRDKLARIEIDVLAHEWALARLISLERAGLGLGAEPSMLKVRGSEIQAELGELLMECAGPYAVPLVEAALEFGYDGPTPAGAQLNAARRPVPRPAQGRDLRRHQRDPARADRQIPDPVVGPPWTSR